MPDYDDPLVFRHEAVAGVLGLAGGAYERADLDRLDVEVTAASLGFSRSITLDLTDVDFLPTLAVGTLIALVRRAERSGVAVVLTAAPGSLAHRVLTVARVPVARPLDLGPDIAI
ncbi:MAG TPA: STAS domain-containing protein [Nocardioides sp.]